MRNIERRSKTTSKIMVVQVKFVKLVKAEGIWVSRQ